MCIPFRVQENIYIHAYWLAMRDLCWPCQHSTLTMTDLYILRQLPHPLAHTPQ